MKPGRNNRLIFLALPVIVVLLALVLYQYGYVSARKEMASIKEVQAVKSRLLEKYMSLIADKPALQEELAAAKAAQKTNRANIIEAQTSSLSAAALQEMLKGVITGRGGSVTSERAEKPDDYANFKVVNVSIDCVLPDARALSDVIYGIETRTPYLVIKEIDTRVRNFKEPRELSVKLKVSALTEGK